MYANRIGIEYRSISFDYFDTWKDTVITEAEGLKIPFRVMGFSALEIDEFTQDFRIFLRFGDDL